LKIINVVDNIEVKSGRSVLKAVNHYHNDITALLCAGHFPLKAVKVVRNTTAKGNRPNEMTACGIVSFSRELATIRLNHHPIITNSSMTYTQSLLP